ncbi:MAG: PEP/pyruvate-binding domain-containing protein [Candidatus Krumholzibacteriia bacterium]
MSRSRPRPPLPDVPLFARDRHDGDRSFTRLGDGALGGKAAGLAAIRAVLRDRLDPARFRGITVAIPDLVVLTTAIFDRFMARNGLRDRALSGDADEVIANAFLRADLPPEILGDLRSLVERTHLPLALRSSSRLEDAMYEPFAGVYATKMIPNNQPDADTRFRRLTEAIKFVYASTFFRGARDYRRATREPDAEEKMAVVVQEIVGERHGDLFYPHVSGVARSWNFYPTGHARPEDGVVDLALGLGKQIVDGGRCWTFSPAWPDAVPPVASARDLVRQSQTEFWAVNMGRPPAYDPTRETEYLARADLLRADYDGVLGHLASTYDAANDRLVMGTGAAGARVLTFAPILGLPDIPLNGLLEQLLRVCGEAVGEAVEIEFALTLGPDGGLPVRFGFLQVRPMVVSQARVEVDPASMLGPGALAASETVLGNGETGVIRDVVYVKPETFDAGATRAIADEIAAFNHVLTAAGRPYLLIGFGRWGSSDPWLGIPVEWAQISGAKAIVEATLPELNVERSQGSHFFHNITSFQVFYFAVHHAGTHRIDWAWLDTQPAAGESPHTRHVRLASPLCVRVDGRSGRGVILK